MKKAWDKVSRVVSVLLVLGMFASVVPAQALAVDEPDSQVEQQGEEQTTEGLSVDETTTGEQSQDGTTTEEQSQDETTGEEQQQDTEAGSQSAEVYSDVAGTPDMLSSKKTIGCKNTFVNETQSDHVHVYYSMDGSSENLKEIKRGDSITMDIVTAWSDFVGIEFYIAVDEGYVYKDTYFQGPTGNNVKLITEYYDELKELNNDAVLPVHYKTVDFTNAIKAAQETYHATYAFMYSGTGGLGWNHASKRTFSVCVERDLAYTEITYVNTNTDKEWSTFVKQNEETLLWNGVDETTGQDWTKEAGEQEALAGWKDSNGQEYALNEEVIPTQPDMTLYTVWKPIPYKYTIEYYYDGSEEPGKAPEGAEEGGSAGYGETVTINPAQSVTVNGQNYILDKENPGKCTVEISENEASNKLAVYYVSDRNKDGIPDKDQTVTLTFDAGEHGTFAEGESGVYTRLPGEAYPEAPAVNVEEGWMLTGWYDANGNLYTAEGEVTDQSESATYTASYEEDRNGDNIPDKNQKYTITYTAGENGTVTVAKETAGIQGVAGIQGSKAVANTGYTVDGWYKGDVKITDGDTLTPDAIKANLNTENGLYKDTAFTARFVQLPQTPAALTGYTVRYLEDGTGYEVASPKTVSGVAVGTTVTETAPDLAGYSLMSDKNPQSITLSSGENVITFYYRAIGGETDTTTAAATPAPAAVPVIPTTPTAPAAPAATRAPAAAGPSVTAAPTTAPTEEPEEEVVPEEETPQAQEPAEDESIADEETPLAGSTASGWALLNLILTILTALGAVVLVVGYFMGYTSIWRLLSLIPGVGGVAAFLLTEDMSQAMTFVDGWTVLMVIIAVVQIVLAVLAMKGKNTYEENDEDEA